MKLGGFMKKKLTACLLILVLSMNLLAFGQITPGKTAGDVLKGYGLITGDGKGHLNESDNLTRAEMTVLMATLRGEKDSAKSFRLASSFSDVDRADWFSPYVAYAEAMGLSQGIGSGKFAPRREVSTKEAASFLLNILDIPHDYASAVDVAREVGIKNGLFSVSSSIRRGDLFAAMHDALYVVPNKEKVTLGEKLGVFSSVPKPTDKAVVLEVLSKSQTTLQVQFSKALQFTEKVKIEVKRLGSYLDYQVSWNGYKDTVVLTFPYALPLGSYEVKITSDEVRDYTGVTNIEQQKVAVIEFPYDRYHLIQVGNTTYGFVNYKVYDQFSQNITQALVAQNLVFGSDVGLATGGFGSIKIEGFVNYLMSQPRTITVTDPASGTTMSKALFPEIKPCTLNSFSFLTKNIEINALNRSIPIDIPYTATDSFGNETKSFDLLSLGLQDLNYTGVGDDRIQLIPSYVTDFSLELIRNVYNPKEGIIRLTPMALAPQTDQIYMGYGKLKLGGEDFFNIVIRK